MTLWITADERGGVVSVKVAQSSDYALLDQAAVEQVKRHWLMPRLGTNQLFETRIQFKLKR